VIKSVVDGSLIFLTGHSNVITTISLSKCGRYVASGQRTEMGQKVSLYTMRERERERDAYYDTFLTHSLSFSPNIFFF
jgi:hypothetical protein